MLDSKPPTRHEREGEITGGLVNKERHEDGIEKTAVPVLSDGGSDDKKAIGLRKWLLAAVTCSDLFPSACIEELRLRNEQFAMHGEICIVAIEAVNTQRTPISMCPLTSSIPGQVRGLQPETLFCLQSSQYSLFERATPN